jgi:hypothetical protein|nr:MAG TPA: hypothetical protein [Caudoviricetes sp.]
MEISKDNAMINSVVGEIDEITWNNFMSLYYDKPLSKIQAERLVQMRKDATLYSIAYALDCLKVENYTLMYKLQMLVHFIKQASPRYSYGNELQEKPLQVTIFKRDGKFYTTEEIEFTLAMYNNTIGDKNFLNHDLARQAIINLGHYSDMIAVCTDERIGFPCMVYL